MTGSATVTAKTGPDIDLTAQPITNIKSFTFDLAKGMAFITHGSPERTTQIALADVGTFTCSISGGHYTIVIS